MSNELFEHRSKKQGHLTPKAIIKDLLDRIESGDVDVESLALVYRTKDDDVLSSWSAVKIAEGLGLVDILHSQLMIDFYDHQ